MTDTDNLRELALRVVTEAIQDAQQPSTQKGLRQLTGYQSPRLARQWMHDTANDSDPGTFGWWCTALGIDPGIILDRLDHEITTSHIHFIR